MALALVWLIWKIYPVLKNHGGIKELFHLQPLKVTQKEEEVEEEVKEEDVPKKEEKAIDKDVDET